MQAEQLSLFQDTDMALPCPFIGRRVAVTGQFTLGRQALRSALLRMGAAEVKFDKLQRNTHYLLLGEAPDTDVVSYLRLYIHDGYNIRSLSTEDLRRIQAGDYAPYQTEEDMTKCLHLTHDHLYWTAPSVSGLKNIRQTSPLALDEPDVLYGKEIYVHASILDRRPELAQLIGCLGGYANTEMADDTDCILMPLSMPAEVCRAVEHYYNAGRSTRFDTPFIILEDLITYLRQRTATLPDSTMTDLMSRLQP